VDVDSSTHVRITNSYVSNGDDCIALKSGWDCFGIKMRRPTKDVLIENMTCTRGGSIAVGSEMSGGVADVLISDALMLNLSGPVLSYRWTQHRGGFVHNITARNVRVEGKINGVGSPDARPVMWVQSNYGCNDVHSHSCWASDGRVNPACPQPEPIAQTTVRDISFQNITGSVPESTPAGAFVGLNGTGVIDQLKFEDISLVAGPWQCDGSTVKGLVAVNVTPAGLAAACSVHKGPALLSKRKM
jgi:polygalacturonase